VGSEERYVDYVIKTLLSLGDDNMWFEMKRRRARRVEWALPFDPHMFTRGLRRDRNVPMIVKLVSLSGAIEMADLVPSRHFEFLE